MLHVVFHQNYIMLKWQQNDGDTWYDNLYFFLLSK